MFFRPVTAMALGIGRAYVTLDPLAAPAVRCACLTRSIGVNWMS